MSEAGETRDPGLFEIIHSTRSMRRLKPDPVPLSAIRKILDAAVRAPSGMNTQPWSFVVIGDEDGKRFIGERYNEIVQARFAPFMDQLDDSEPMKRVLRAVLYQGEHLHESPVLLLVCGRRDWPASVPEEKRVGVAPPPYGSIYPCVQNILLSCRALGLGATPTSIHQVFERELAERFGIPFEEFGIVSMIPIGYPKGRFGPVSRTPAEELTYFDAWGGSEPSKGLR